LLAAPLRLLSVRCVRRSPMPWRAAAWVRPCLSTGTTIVWRTGSMTPLSY
jgi:hypothetical protein